MWRIFMGIRWALCILTIAAFPSTSPAAIIQYVNTGFNDSTLVVLANGVLDSQFVIAPGGTGGHIGEVPVVRSAPIPPTWIQDSASSQSRWLVLPGTGLEGISISGGTYFFSMSVDLNGFLPSTAFINGLQYAADNKLVGVVINGTDVYRQPATFAEEFQVFHPLGNVGLGLFTSGINNIRFEVYNESFSPMGLRLEGQIMATPVPEPASICLVTLGLPLVLMLKRQRYLYAFADR